MTQLQKALNGVITEEMKSVSESEGLDPELVRERIACGTIIIPANINRKSGRVGIGKGLRTKVNASIGTSTDIVDQDMEVRKAMIAEKYGADTLMDLSVGGDIAGIRRAVMAAVSACRHCAAV